MLDKSTERKSDAFQLEETDNFFRATFPWVQDAADGNPVRINSSNSKLPQGCTGMAVVTEKGIHETQFILFSKRDSWTVERVQQQVRRWVNFRVVPCIEGMAVKLPDLQAKSVVTKVKPPASFNWQSKQSKPPVTRLEVKKTNFVAQPMEFKVNHIYREYSPAIFSVLKRLPTNSIDATITDPPYNLGKRYKSGIDDKKKMRDYISWCQVWLSEIIRVTKPTGSIIMWLWPEYIGIVDHMMRSKFSNHVKFVQYLYWRADGRPNPGAKKQRIVVTPAIHYAGKACNGKGFYFNLDAIREKRYRSEHTIDEHVHELGKDPGNLWDDEEVRHGNAWLREILGALHSQGYDFLDSNNPISYVKNINWNRSDRLKTGSGEYHPCQMPISVPLKAIKMVTRIGDKVLDLFNGTGTTMAACAMSGRNGIGIEISPDYIQVATNRLREIKLPAPDLKKYWPDGFPTVTSDPVPDAKPIDVNGINLVDFFDSGLREVSSTGLFKMSMG